MSKKKDTRFIFVLWDSKNYMQMRWNVISNTYRDIDVEEKVLCSVHAGYNVVGIFI